MNNQYKIIEETGYFDKGNESIRARIVEVGKARKLDIRAYHLDNDGNWRPTRRGLSIHEDLQEEFVTAVIHMCNRADALRREAYCDRLD